ncbi:MAG: hypothetical protein FJ033_11650 [Chloroflexi bacterium]|nr:hypothetical protein [Chloroflexota bacterium]
MPLRTGAMMRLIGRAPAPIREPLFTAMKPLMPRLFPILLPGMMPKMLPEIAPRYVLRMYAYLRA